MSWKEERVSSDRPIVIGGCPRSGTTLMQLMLHAHPRIAIPPETRFVLSGYRLRLKFEDLSLRANRQMLAEWLIDRRSTKIYELKLDEDRLRRRIIDEGTTLGTAFGLVFQEYALRFGKARWGDKRPGYIMDLDRVLKLFPNAQVINMVRDGRACVASLKEMPFWKRDIEETVSVWARSVDEGRRWGRILGPERYKEIRYEDLVASPETVVRELCDFLDEDFDPAMLSPRQLASEAVPERKKWHARTHGEIDQTAVRKWESTLTEDEIRLCEVGFGKRLRENGYPASGLPRLGLEQELHYWMVHSQLVANRVRLATMDARRSLVHRYPLGETLSGRDAPNPTGCESRSPTLPGSA